MTSTTSLDQLLGGLAADMASQTIRPKCPKCAGRLTVTVTVYPRVAVSLEVWGDGHAKARYTDKIIETKRALDDTVDDDYGGARVDERDELYCEHYGPDGCDFWVRPADLELAGGKLTA